ncbi:hypothetical protein [Actinoplanes sp. NPDC049802]|uniref:hypothetical protein n=1 Tax=Actinoplanes sp. NPDC049802 TaxID=3154742 RepID=UPI0033E54E9A
MSQASSPAATIPSYPAQAIAAAKARLGTESARFSRDMNYEPLDFTGVVNAQTKNWEIRGEDYTVRRIGSELYIRVTGETLRTMSMSPATSVMSSATADRFAAGGWIRTRLPNFRETSVVFNDEFPWNLAGPATRATAVTATGDRSFAGTVTVADHDSLSTRAKEVPVSVELDETGRFSKITVTTKPDLAMVVTFSDFGGPSDIMAPPGSEENDLDGQLLLPLLGLR